MKMWVALQRVTHNFDRETAKHWLLIVEEETKRRKPSAYAKSKQE